MSGSLSIIKNRQRATNVAIYGDDRHMDRNKLNLLESSQDTFESTGFDGKRLTLTWITSTINIGFPKEASCTSFFFFENSVFPFSPTYTCPPSSSWFPFFLEFYFQYSLNIVMIIFHRFHCLPSQFPFLFTTFPKINRFPMDLERFMLRRCCIGHAEPSQLVD